MPERERYLLGTVHIPGGEDHAQRDIQQEGTVCAYAYEVRVDTKW